MGPTLDDRDLEESKRTDNRAKMGKKENYKLNKMVYANGDIYNYDEAGKLMPDKIDGRHIQSALQIDRSFTYTISDKRF
jgi:hypothetical protein